MFEIKDTIFVLIDVQEKLGAIMYEKEQLLRSMTVLVDGIKCLGVPIAWMEQIPEKMGATIPELRERLEGLSPLAKESFSCCGEDDFVRARAASKRRQVLLAGIEAHVCVYQTAAHLVELGYDVQVVGDCVSSRTPANRETGLERIRAVGAGVTSVETILFELMQTSTHPAFRDILRLVK